MLRSPEITDVNGACKLLKMPLSPQFVVDRTVFNKTYYALSSYLLGVWAAPLKCVPTLWPWWRPKVIEDMQTNYSEFIIPSVKVLFDVAIYFPFPSPPFIAY